jgi:hypothetical protein
VAVPAIPIVQLPGVEGRGPCWCVSIHGLLVHLSNPLDPPILLDPPIPPDPPTALAFTQCEFVRVCTVLLWGFLPPLEGAIRGFHCTSEGYHQLFVSAGLVGLHQRGHRVKL